ncbi:MAG: 3-phosphoshikimate 1-carboxyvinyltransferase [Acidimicrobiales bacterium]
MSSASVTIEPLAARPDATVVVPGSKSHTNRALVCAALADGRSRLDGALFADDTRAMAGALAALGIGVTADAEAETITVDGCGGRLPPGPATLDVAQSGTASRFVLALLGVGPGPYRLDGHPQLRGRPVGPLADALRQLGVGIAGDSLPLEVAGGRLRTGTVALSGSVSSQFLSGLLLAAPYATAARGAAPDPAAQGAAPDPAAQGAAPDPAAQGAARDAVPGSVRIEITDTLVSTPYVELTLSTMADFGVSVDRDGYRWFSVSPQRYRARTLAIEPDASAASYFFAAAAVTGGRVRVPGLGRHTVQGDLRFVDLLARMGARVTVADDYTEVEGTGELHGIDVDMADISDTAQTLAVAATFASGPTRVRGIGFIQHKETDRVRAVVTELQRLGIGARRLDDGFVVEPGVPRPGRVATYDDHRMAMSFALLGLVHPGIEVENPGCVAKTFPRFFTVLDGLRRPQL